VAETNDDAAHPRAAVDTRGHVWVTYYRWIPWQAGRSRDREIFVRYHDGDHWSEPMQVSPTDVPRYEDHADPSIAADAAGNVWIAWSWDTHPQQDHWPFAPTFGPAIFARQLRAGHPPSRLQMVAMRASSLRAAKRNPAWAFLPEVYCCGDRPWFCFETHTVGGDHACGIAAYEPGHGFPAPTLLGHHAEFVCTPRLIADRAGCLHALWSAPAASHYAVHRARLRDGGGWDDPRVAWSSPSADLRFAAAAFDRFDFLWIAAVQIRPGGSEVVVKSIVP
jgi:hypothetical protein